MLNCMQVAGVIGFLIQKIKLQKKKINHLHAKIICIKIRSQARDCSKTLYFTHWKQCDNITTSK